MGCNGCTVICGGVKGMSLDVFSWSPDFQLIEGLFPEFQMKSKHITAQLKARSGPCTPSEPTPASFPLLGSCRGGHCRLLIHHMLILEAFVKFLIHLANTHLSGPRKLPLSHLFKAFLCNMEISPLSFLSSWICEICENMVCASSLLDHQPWHRA